MIKPAFVVIASLLAANVPAAEPRPDPHDESVASIKAAYPKLGYLESDGATVAYEPAGTRVINKMRKDLPAGHLLRTTEEPVHLDTVLLETSLGGPQRYYVVFTWFASADPAFYFVKSDAKVEENGPSVQGTALAIPGKGAILVASRHNNYFTKRQKYLLTPKGLEEVPQPFFAVGLKTRALKPITLYATPMEDIVVAQLSAGHAIEVVLTDDKHDKQSRTCFLVKTPGGILGWVWVPSSQFKSDTIDGISWWGD